MKLQDMKKGMVVTRTAPTKEVHPDNSYIDEPMEIVGVDECCVHFIYGYSQLYYTSHNFSGNFDDDHWKLVEEAKEPQKVEENDYSVVEQALEDKVEKIKERIDVLQEVFTFSVEIDSSEEAQAVVDMYKKQIHNIEKAIKTLKVGQK